MKRAKKRLVAILNYNGSLDTLSCIQSFYMFENRKEYNIVIWDNSSELKQKEVLISGLEDMQVKYINCNSYEYDNIDIINQDITVVFSEENLGFAKGVNRIIEKRLENYEYIILLNNDTEFVESTTNNLCKYLDYNKEVDIVTSSIYYFNDKDRIWNAGGKSFWGTRKYYTEKYVKRKIKKEQIEETVDFITGCFLVTRASLLKKYGVLSEKFFFGEEDYEFCLRMIKNKVILKVLFNEKIYHKVGASIKRDVKKEEVYRRAFIHHINRFIDMKYFYSGVKWNIWRFFSSLYIGVMMFVRGYVSCAKAFEYIRVLNTYSKNRMDVDKNFFLRVLQGEII